MLLRLLFVLAMLLPTVAQAATLFSEDFESSVAALQAKYSCSYSSPSTYAPWVDNAAQDWDSSQKFAGTYSLKQRYGGSQYDTPPQGGGSCEFDFADQTQRDIWITWYHRFGPGFQTAGGGGVGGVATKGIYMYMKSLSTGSVHGWVFHYFYGGQQLTMSAQGIKDHKGPNGPGTGTVIPYDTENMWQNVSGFNQPDGDWVCYEANYKLNTPGQADGQYLLYATNVSQGGTPILRASHTNREFLDTTPQGQSPSDSRWFRFKFYRQDGLGDMWYDNVSVTTTRTGCTGGAPPPPDTDTVPPTVPTNVTVSNTVPLQQTISWTASTDASSPITYTVDYCTGAACTPATTLTSTTSVSAVHSSLTGGTVYGYRVRARDPNGNISATTTTVYGTASSTPVGTDTLAVNSSGLFVLNGTQTFLLGASYFDALNYRTADLDTLAANGFNAIRIFVNWRENLGSTESVCDAAGALVAGRVTTINALIDYAETLNMVVDMVVLSENSNSLMVNQADRLTCVSNVVEAFDDQPLVMFDVVQEHDVNALPWANETAEIKLYTDAARTACSTCLIFASGTSTPTNGIAPADTTATLTAGMKTNILGKLNTNGESLLAVHDYRSANWYSITGTRVLEYRNYLASVGRTSTPLIFDEPCRYDGYSAECDASSASNYIEAAVQAKSAGAAMWVWHTNKGFSLDTQSMFQQLTALEASVYPALANALSTPTDTEPSLLETWDLNSGAVSDRMSGGIETNDTPTISSGRLRANATGTQSVGVYNGVTTTLTSLFTCTAANAGPPPSGGWLTLSGNGLKVISNQCGQDGASGSGVEDSAVWNTDYTDDQVVQATLDALPTNSTPDQALLGVRVQSTAAYDNMYELEIDRPSGTWRKRLYKLAGGVYTQLGSTDTTTVSAGAVFKLTAVGGTITAYQDGVVIASAQDTTFPTGGYLQIGSIRATTPTSVRWTNFAGGDYTASTEIPANQGLTADLTTATGSNPMYVRIGVRMQTGTDYSGYDCRVDLNPDTASIYRKDNDNPVLLAGPLSITATAGDVYGCWATGSTIYMTQGAVDSTPILSTTDATYSTGKPYVYLNTAGEALANLELDNLTLYEYVAAAPACTPSITTAVADATGADVTWPAACPPTQIRVETGLSTQTFSLSAFPSGRYTPTGGWKLDDGFACFKAVDSQGVINQTDYVCDSLAGLIAVDTAVPVMTMTLPTGELPNGTTSTTASFTTDEPATCRWETSNTTYALMENTATTAGVTHSFNATGLTTGTTNFYAQCTDFAEPTANVTTTALTLPIIVAASTADVTAPTTVTNLVANATSPSQISLTHTLSTDAGGAVTYEAWISTDNVTFVFKQAYTGVPVSIDGLTPSTLYYLKVLAIDASLNPAATYSNVASATTPNILDVNAPSDPAGLIVTGTYTHSATIAWTPGSDDRGNVTTNVEICSGSAACTAFSLVGTTNGSTYTIGPPNITLTPNTIYRVRIKHSDGAGNVSANYSDRVTFTTATLGTILPRQPVATSQPRLPRN